MLLLNIWTGEASVDIEHDIIVSKTESGAFCSIPDILKLLEKVSDKSFVSECLLLVRLFKNNSIFMS